MNSFHWAELPAKQSDVPVDLLNPEKCQIHGAFFLECPVGEDMRRLLVYIPESWKNNDPVLVIVPPSGLSAENFLGSSGLTEFSRQRSVMAAILVRDPQKDPEDDGHFMNAAYKKLQKREYFVAMQDCFYAMGVGDGSPAALKSMLSMGNDWSGAALLGGIQDVTAEPVMAEADQGRQTEELLKFSTDGRAVRLISTIAITGIEATAKIAKGFVIVREYAAATFMAIADLGVSIWNGIQGSAMLAFTGVIKSVNTLVEYVPAAFKQMRNILSAIWDGIKWACASMFSGLVNLVLKAVNSVIGLLKKIPGVKLEMVKKPAFASQVEAFAKQAGENARKKFQDVANSKEFTDAGKRTEEKNAKWKSTDQKGEALVQKSANGILSAANRFSVAGENIERIGESIDKMSGSATSKILDWQSTAESDLAKKNKKGDVGKEEKITGTAKSATEKKSEKIATDSLTKIGLYGNFRSDAVRSIDRERNKLLENILAKVSEMKEGGLLA